MFQKYLMKYVMKINILKTMHPFFIFQYLYCLQCQFPSQLQRYGMFRRLLCSLGQSVQYVGLFERIM